MYSNSQETNSRINFQPEILVNGSDVVNLNEVIENQLSKHKKEKPKHKCPQCELDFTLKCTMTRHIQTVHEGKKSYKCEICGAAFGQNQHLDKHVLSIHEKKKPFKCEICEINFAEKNTLKKHILAVHEKIRAFQFCLSYFMN